MPAEPDNNGNEYATARLTKREEEAVHRAFVAFDMDGNDTIELDELYELMKVLKITDIPPEDVERQFRKLDVDNSNSLDYQEFLAMFLAIKERYHCTPKMAAAVLQKRPNARSLEDVDRLSHFLYGHVPLFSQFSRAMRTELCRHMTCKTYEEGDWLYTQGAAAHAVYVPLEGTLSVWANPVPSHGKQKPNDDWLKTAPRDQDVQFGQGRQSMGGISFGRPSVASFKSRATSIAPSTHMSDDEGCLEDAVGERSGKLPSTQGKAAQVASKSRLTAAALDSLQRQMQQQQIGRLPTGHAGPAAEPGISRAEVAAMPRNGPQSDPARASGQQSATVREDPEGHSNKPVTPVKGSRGVAFGQDVALGKGGSGEEQQTTPRGRHSRKPSAAFECSSQGSDVFSQMSTPFAVQPPSRAAGQECQAGVHSTPCRLAREALRLSAKSRRESRVDGTGVRGGAGSGSADSAHGPAARKLGGDVGARGGARAGMEAESLFSQRSSAELQLLPSRNASLAHRPSVGSVAWGSTASMRLRKPSVTKVDPATLRAVLWSGEISALTSNDQVNGDLVSELTWAVSDMHSQAAYHNRNSTKRVQVPAFLGFCRLGQWLGEPALLPHLGLPEPRTHCASVLAATTVTACMLEGSVFKAAMDAVRGCCSPTYLLRPEYLMDLSGMQHKLRSTPEEAKLVHYLSCVPSLAEMPAEMRVRLSRSLQPRCFSTGEVVMRQGFPSDAMYIILDGDVGIYQRPLGDHHGLARQSAKSPTAHTAAPSTRTAPPPPAATLMPPAPQT